MHKEESLKYNREYRIRNTDRVREREQKYRAENKDKRSKSIREYRAKNTDHIRENQRQYRARNHDKHSAYMREYHKRTKLRGIEKRKARDADVRERLFQTYGRECVCCHEKEERFLTLGHLKNDGHVERKHLHQVAIYKKAINHPDPQRYAIQCFNCNMGARCNHGICPHQESSQDAHSNNVSYGEKLRGRFFEIYGDRCVCCGESNKRFLTLGHINNDGYLEKANFDHKMIMKKAIEHPDFTKYETQCFNCNTGAHMNGGVCPHKVKET